VTTQDQEKISNNELLDRVKDALFNIINDE
jgi:hypothetical protein